MTTQQPGWYPDPANATRQRWWDGAVWSPHVAVNGATWVEPLPAAPPSPRSRRRMPVWAWIILGVLALGLMLLLSPVVALIALIVLITGIVALAKGSGTWLRFGSRKAAIAVTAAAAAALLVSGSVSAAMLPNTGNKATAEASRFTGTASDDENQSESSSSSRSDPTATRTPTPTPVKTTREEVITEAIPFTESRVDDGALPQGQTQVRTPGQNGEKSLTYLVHMVDGEEVSRELVSEQVTTPPVGQVVANGTYVAPPPPAPAPAPAQPAGGCDSNYADACVPVSSDVDCAGGGGNGPAYFDGVARIVGRDVYDLDADGDGLACEPY
jgi:hypothetical protein